MENERLAYENKGKKTEGENHCTCLLFRGAVWRRGEANLVQNGQIKSSFSSVYLRRPGDGQFVHFSSGQGG